MSQFFDNAVAGIADRWGAPKFHGEAADRGFPAWSVAQRLASWPKGDGRMALNSP
jgi:hypothetical protein